MEKKVSRSRSGCKACKKFKIKCDQTKPRCKNCVKRNIMECDYSLTLHWGGRPYKDTAKKVAKIPNTTLVDGVITVCQQPKRGVTKNAYPTRYGVVVEHISPVRNELVRSHIGPSTFSNLNGQLLPCGERPLSDCDLALNGTGPLSLHALHLPSPLPRILSSSTYYMELFEFYLRETCHLLVPVPREIYRKNPFYVVLPQIAMQSPTLLYLLLAFGANHRNMMRVQSVTTETSFIDLLPLSSDQESFELFKNSTFVNDFASSIDNASVTDSLLSKAFKELVHSFKDHKERTSDGTLATIMMLAAYDIFFSDKRRKWRAHVYGARSLMLERLQNSNSNTLTIPDVVDDSDSQFFLTRWFTYVDIIGSLSSTNRVITFEKLSSLKYEFKHYEGFDNARKIELNDIEYSTGMEPKVLSLLADTSWIICEKEKQSDSEMDDISTDLLLQTLELDYKINKHLEESEVQRENIYELHFKDMLSTDRKVSERYKGYVTLRATNMIFGLVGSLQLKRRVLKFPLTSIVIKDLLLKITKIVDEHIPLASSSTSCVIFCLFCCGCELLEDSMIEYRSVYMDRIESLNRRGVSSAAMAKQLMEQCWAGKKCWWDLLKENNLDITFAI